jgi:hypothetical protein
MCVWRRPAGQPGPAPASDDRYQLHCPEQLPRGPLATGWPGQIADQPLRCGPFPERACSKGDDSVPGSPSANSQCYPPAEKDHQRDRELHQPGGGHPGRMPMHAASLSLSVRTPGCLPIPRAGRCLVQQAQARPTRSRSPDTESDYRPGDWAPMLHAERLGHGVDNSDWLVACFFTQIFPCFLTRPITRWSGMLML